MRRILLVAVLLAACPLVWANEKTQGWCEQGGVSVAIPGTQGSGTQKFQQSFVLNNQGCTVTVYNAGTLTVSTIYADNSATPKANPFTASNTGYWFFYAANGRYDVKFSGAGIASPFTLGDNLLFDPAEVDPAAVCSQSSAPFFCQGGNAFGATAVIGTTDNNIISTIINSTQVATFTAYGINLFQPGSTIGNNVTQFGDTDVVLLMDNTTADPSFTVEEELRGLSAACRVTYTKADPNPGADNKCLNGITVITSANAGNLIYGQQTGVRGDNYFLGSGYTVQQVEGFQATLPQLNVGVTVTNWSGFLASPPATGGTITNGGGFLCENMDTGAGTITNAYCLSIGGINSYGQIKWLDASITQDSGNNLVLTATGAIITGVGLLVGAGGTQGVGAGSYAIGTTDIINPDLSITTTAPITGKYFQTFDGLANPTPSPGCSPAELRWFSYNQTPYVQTCAGSVTQLGGGGGGSGTVTSFSSGNLSPLFTASVATATTTPALTFALSNAGAFTELQNNTASSAGPAYTGYTCVEAQTTSYSVVAADSRCLIVMTDASASNLTLPATVPGTPTASWRIELKALGGGTVSILRNGNNIDGGTSTPTVASGSSLAILGNGAAYWTEPGNGGSGSGACPNSTSCILAGSSATAGANANTADIYTGTLNYFAYNWTTNSILAGGIDKNQRWGVLTTTAFNADTELTVNQSTNTGGLVVIAPSGTVALIGLAYNSSSALTGQLTADASGTHLSSVSGDLYLNTATSAMVVDSNGGNPRVIVGATYFSTDLTTNAGAVIANTIYSQNGGTNTNYLELAAGGTYNEIVAGRTTSSGSYKPIAFNVSNGVYAILNTAGQMLFQEASALSADSVVEINAPNSTGAGSFALVLNNASGNINPQIDLSYGGGGQSGIGRASTVAYWQDTQEIQIGTYASGVYTNSITFVGSTNTATIFAGATCGTGATNCNYVFAPTGFGLPSYSYLDLPNSGANNIVWCSTCVGAGDTGWTAGMLAAVVGNGSYLTWTHSAWHTMP